MSNVKSHSNGLQELARLVCSHSATKTLGQMFLSLTIQLKANRVDHTESKSLTPRIPFTDTNILNLSIFSSIFSKRVNQINNF